MAAAHLMAPSPVVPSHFRSRAEVKSNNYQFPEYAAPFHTSCFHRQSFLFETIPSHPHPPNITTTSAWLLRFLFDSMHVSPLLKLYWNPQTTMTRIYIYLCYCIKYTALQQLVHTLIQFENNINFTVKYNTYELLIICQCFTGSILIWSPIRWLPLFLPNL